MSKLSVAGLQKSYGKKQVLKKVDLDVGSGEVVGLLGSNGAGKTTAFYCIVGLVRADGGTIRLDDTEISHLPMHQRAKLGIGYLPQEASVFRKLSVEDNILAVLELNASLKRDARNARLEQLLDDLQIEHVRKTLGISLSGGERRRVEIARALASDPAFILLDEPFAGVDPIAVIDIQKIVTHLTERNIGVLITDHNVRETLGICERAYILHEGEVMVSGLPAEIVNNPTARQVYLGEDFTL